MDTQWLPPPDTDPCALLVLFSRFGHFAVKFGTTPWPLPFWSPVILNDTRKPSSASPHTVSPGLQHSHHDAVRCQHLFISRLVSLEGDALLGVSKEYIGIARWICFNILTTPKPWSLLSTWARWICHPCSFLEDVSAPGATLATLKNRLQGFLVGPLVPKPITFSFSSLPSS